tara:strand:+ start:763 stop:1005 length:243 start_codon:yes stop_codon:yes gene_type:complete
MIKENKYYVFGSTAVNIVTEMEENYSDLEISNKIYKANDLFEVLEFDMNNPNPDLLLDAYDGWMAYYPINEELFKLLKHD